MSEKVSFAQLEDFDLWFGEIDLKTTRLRNTAWEVDTLDSFRCSRHDETNSAVNIHVKVQ